MFVMKAGRAFTKFQVISFLSFEYLLTYSIFISMNIFMTVEFTLFMFTEKYLGLIL